MIITVQCPSCVTSFPVDTDKVPPAGVSARCSICASIFRVEKPALNGNEPGVTTASTAEVAEVPDAATATVDPEVDESWSEVGAPDAPEEEGEPISDGTETWVESEDEAQIDAEPFAEAAAPPEPEVEPASEFEPVVESGPAEEPEEDWRIEGFDVEESSDLPDFEIESASESDLEASPDEDAVDAPIDVELTELVTDEPEDVAPALDVSIEAPLMEAEVEEPEIGEPAGDGVSETAEPPATFQFGKRDPQEKAQRLARVLVSDMIMYNPERHDRALAGGTLRDDFDDEIKRSWEEYITQIGEEIALATPYFTDALNDILAKGEQVFEGTPPD